MEKAIVGEKIYLRPMQVEDTDLILSWRNADIVKKNFIYQKDLTREQHLNWIHEKVEKGEVIQFIVCDKETDKPLGSTYLQHFEREHHKAEWGIFLAEEACGKGIGSQAAELTKKYAFEVCKLHKVFGRILAFNEASIRIQQKAGFQKEAYLKDDVLINGKYQDVILMAALSPCDIDAV